MVTIKTERLVLRPYRPADVDDLYRNVQDKRIHAMTAALPHPYTKKNAVEWIAMNNATAHRKKKKDRLAFAVEYKKEVVGSIGLHKLEAHKAEIGYWLAPHAWGKGLMTEAVSAVTKYALGTLKLRRIYATAFVNNKASQRVLEKAGYRHEGLMKNSHLKNGRCVDATLYAKVK